jgi:putative transposase
MMQDDQLPLVETIDNERFAQAFEEHAVEFGDDQEAVYTPAITLWALVSQVFFANEMRSCKAAVARVASLWAALGRVVCGTNTGAYCRARAKISCDVIRTITKRLASDAETQLDEDSHAISEHPESALTPSVVAEVNATPTDGRILLVDGFTVTAADTPENQAEYPQNPRQTKGLGFPILRCLTLVSMASGMLVDLVHGPYSGKETGETALMRKLFTELRPGDTLVADCYLCTYWIVAACLARGVKIVMKNHHKREDHPADARRLCKGQRLVVWDRPNRPEWMSEEEYQQQPDTIAIRLVDVQVPQKGFRPAEFTVATTMLDRKVDSGDWIASVYRSRWLVELDIRSIKCSLGMDILRGKSPGMLRTELWSCLLAYNLIRLRMLQSSAVEGRAPRSMSFTTTMQLLATNWLLCAVIGVTAELAQLGHTMSCSEQVGHREGRFEPRKNKRRPKVLALMTKPRHTYQSENKAAT